MIAPAEMALRVDVGEACVKGWVVVSRWRVLIEVIGAGSLLVQFVVASKRSAWFLDVDRCLIPDGGGGGGGGRNVPTVGKGELVW